MVNREIVKAKIAHIEKSLGRLREKRNATEEEVRRDLDLQDVIIHNLQLAIQGCIDIASHITSDEGWRVPGSLAGLFDVLSEHKVIPGEMADTMRSMVGFRNIIVHEYEDIDLKKVYQILKDHLGDINSFLKQISSFAKL